LKGERIISKLNFTAVKKETNLIFFILRRERMLSLRLNPPQFVPKLILVCSLPEDKGRSNDLGRAYTERKGCMHKLSRIACGEAIKRGNES